MMFDAHECNSIDHINGIYLFEECMIKMTDFN